MEDEVSGNIVAELRKRGIFGGSVRRGCSSCLKECEIR